MPVQFDDNSNRSLNMAYNFQSQYLVPRTPQTVYSAPAFTGASRAQREEPAISDDSRQLMYSGLEFLWDRKGKPGYECVLKAICEVSQSPLSHNGLLGEVLDAVFTWVSWNQSKEDILLS